jgi:quinol-cytochrome oxidoreductase complex cytochrome b subunit
MEDSQQRLDRLERMTRDNNRMLHTMRRNAFFGGLLKFIFWVVILVVIPYYLWLYVQPYVQQAQGTYQSVQTTQQQVASSTSALSGFFNQFRSFFGGN